MSAHLRTVLALMVTLLCGAQAAVAHSVTPCESGAFQDQASDGSLLAPPTESRPVIVRADFQVHRVNAIDEGNEAFEFSGVLTLEWKDSRQAFDPVAFGAAEKVFQGAYQFNEVSTGWYPQLVLVSESGMFTKSGTLLRVGPDGTSTLVETINATAKATFEIRRFPFDE